MLILGQFLHCPEWPEQCWSQAVRPTPGSGGDCHVSPSVCHTRTTKGPVTTAAGMIGRSTCDVTLPPGAESNRCFTISIADEIVATLGEGTFGRVVECKDLHRWVTSA